MPWRGVWPGSLFFTVTIGVANAVFPFYLTAVANIDQVGGVIGFVLVALVWFYLVSLGLMAGAVINALRYELHDTGVLDTAGWTGRARRAAAGGPRVSDRRSRCASLPEERDPVPWSGAGPLASRRPRSRCRPSCSSSSGSPSTWSGSPTPTGGTCAGSRWACCASSTSPHARSIVVISKPLTLLRFRKPEYVDPAGDGPGHLADRARRARRQGRARPRLPADHRPPPARATRRRARRARRRRGRELLSAAPLRRPAGPARREGLQRDPAADPRLGDPRVSALARAAGPAPLPRRRAARRRAGATARRRPPRPRARRPASPRAGVTGPNSKSSMPDGS